MSRYEAVLPARVRAAISASPLTQRLAGGAFWSTLGAVLSQALALVGSIATARLLGREQFGQYGMVLSTVGMVTAFAGFGLGATATRYVAEHRCLDPERAGRIVALSSLVSIATGLVACAALLIFAPFLAARSLASPQLSGLIRLASGMILLGAVNGAQMGALAGFEAFRRIARLNLYGGALTCLLVVLGVWAYGLSGALLGQVAALALICLLSRLALRAEARRFGVPLGYAGCGRERAVLLAFSLPAVLAGLMVAPVNWACAAILVNAPQGYAEMGIFNAAAAWQRAILFLPGSIGAIVLPMLAELHGAQKRQQYQKALRVNLILNGGAALCVFPVLALCSRLIMRSYGPAFEAGHLALILLGCSAVLFALGSVIGNAIASAGNMWYGFLFNAMWGCVYVAAAWYLAPRYGAAGLALANCIAYLLHLCWQLPYLRKS